MSNSVYLSIKNKDDIVISDLWVPDFIKRDESKKAFSLLFDMFNYLGLDIDIKDVCYKDNGKPYIKNSNIKFNYSHSKNYIACSVSSVEVGIDIEDEFNISNEAASLYLSGISDNFRRAFVTKEAYCKLLGDFNDDFFRNLDINSISDNKYEICNDQYDLVLYYEGVHKNIVELMDLDM